MNDILTRLQNAGFTVKLDGDGFTVMPSYKLNSVQRDYLKANKAAIMAALLKTVVYTPNGKRMEIQARDAEHQAWLIRMNHNSPVPCVFND